MGSVVLAGATSGSTTITPSATGTYTLTLPAETGTIQTSGAGFTTNGVAYATSTSALATGSALTFDGSNLAASGKITAGLKGSTFTTIDQQAIIANTTWSGANPRVLIYLTKSGAGSGGLGIDASNDVTVFDTSGTGRLTANSTGVNVTGSTGLTFNTSNAGIVFNNSGALTNSTLNDYETGSFSPTWSGSTSGSGVRGTGIYTKIGNLVFVTVVVQGVTFITFSGSLQMSLPFTAGGLVNAQYTGAPIYFYDGSWFTDPTTAGITPYANYGSNQATFGYMYVNGLRQTSVASTTSSLSGNSNFYARFSFMYQTN